MNNELYYFMPYEYENVTYSCDMLYLKFRYNDDHLHYFLQNELNHYNEDYSVDYYESKKHYQYKHLFVINFLKYDYKVIIKFQLEKEHIGVIEFNPNHLMTDPEFPHFYFALISNFYNLEYYKMDFSIDIPVDRSMCKVLRDNRKYMKFVQGSVTEYLGCRNKHNHVKIYDKTYESNLTYYLTRIEITVENNIPIKYPNIKIQIPQQQLQLKSLTPKEEFIMGLLSEVDDPYFHLRRLQKRDREKYEKLLSNNYFDFNACDCAYLQVLFNMRDYFLFTI